MCIYVSFTVLTFICLKPYFIFCCEYFCSDHGGWNNVSKGPLSLLGFLVHIIMYKNLHSLLLLPFSDTNGNGNGVGNVTRNGKVCVEMTMLSSND